MNIELLPWDSNFFNLKIGRIILNDNDDLLNNEFEYEIKTKDFDLVYIFKYNKIISSELLLRYGIELVDTQLTMSKLFNKREVEQRDFNLLNKLNKKDLADCISIAEDTAHVSRFFQEKLIGPNKTKEMYREWIFNALNKSFSDGLFVEKIDGVVVGIHLIKTDIQNETGYFTLTGVNPKIKRRGVGKNLWLQSYNYWSGNHNIVRIKSPFSLQNRESFNFHLKMGFNKIDEVKYIYHYRK